MNRTCPFCGAVITRRRGNLRRQESWARAVVALYVKHLKVKHPREWEDLVQQQKLEDAGASRQ